MLGTNELEVFTAPSDWPAARILSTSEDHDRYQTDMNDINAFFPTTRMREFLREEVFGSLSRRNYYRTLPNYSHRKTTEGGGQTGNPPAVPGGPCGRGSADAHVAHLPSDRG